jgi:hypothetical protein
MDGQALVFPKGNDIVVTARFPEISSGAGMTSEFYYKGNRYIADSDPTTEVYTSSITADPGNPGATMSQFRIPATDNGVAGAFWWRVDAIDSTGSRRTAAAGTLLVEAVLWQRKLREKSGARNGLCVTGLKGKAGQKLTGVSQVTLTGASRS